ncbi:hypothetical protein KR026_011959 [Drosophila bipectinata]|nr:hypothetical protein KR026_011959 [Drosophila bipectinata]
MIIAGDRYALTEKENNMYAIEMILHIKRLQSSDFGGYKCISKNSIGDTEGTIRLYEMERPGKKHSRLDEDANEVTKHEVVMKDNRHEDGSRNTNGRLYKDRNQEQDMPNSGDSGPRTQAQGTIRLIGTFVLALLVLLTATAEAQTTTAEKTTMMSCDGNAEVGVAQRNPDTKVTAARTLEVDAARTWDRSTSWQQRVGAAE